MSIGRFAKLTGLSEKTLRRYAKTDVLPPARIDPRSRYRWYSRNQVEDAKLIAMLRELEMPLRRIREVMAATDSSDRWHQIRTFLSEQWQDLAEKERLLARIHATLTGRALPVSSLGPFEGIQEDALRELSDAFVPVSLPADVPLFEQGDPPDALFVVSSGSVRVVVWPPAEPLAEPALVAVLGEGGVVGEMGILDAAPRSASVYTNEPSQLLRLSKHAYRAVAARHPEIEARLRAIASKRRPAKPPRTHRS